MSDPVIDIQNVSYSFNGPSVLSDVSLQIYKGEFLGIVGPNGGGKSTLLKLVLGLIEPDSGSIEVLGKTPRKARLDIGYVPQYVHFERNFPITVEDAVLLGRIGNTRLFQRYTSGDRKAVEQALIETEISQLRNRRLNELSGGQFQRVLIARALVSGPEILILDEATSNIDLRMEEDIFELLKNINQRSTIVVVSHDIGFISGFVNRVACLNNTLVCHETSEISAHTLEELYGDHVHMIDHHHHH